LGSFEERKERHNRFAAMLTRTARDATLPFGILTSSIDSCARVEFPLASLARGLPNHLLHLKAGQIVGRVRYPYAFASFRIIDVFAFSSPFLFVLAFTYHAASACIAMALRRRSDHAREPHERMRNAEAYGRERAAHRSL
jgi:hypothetical protein